MKQISLTMPEVLFQASKKYCQGFGYKNLQEFILALIRKKVIAENIERYKEIEERMKKGIGIKRFNQEDAVTYLKGL